MMKATERLAVKSTRFSLRVPMFDSQYTYYGSSKPFVTLVTKHPLLAFTPDTHVGQYS